MSNKEIANLTLGTSTRIVFSISEWKGRRRGDIRKFVSSKKYSGPTPSGLTLDPVLLGALVDGLKSLEIRPLAEGAETIGKSGNDELKLTIVSSDDPAKLPDIDIRLFVNTESYRGPTKSGVRFVYSSLKEFTNCAEALSSEFNSKSRLEDSNAGQTPQSSKRPCKDGLSDSNRGGEMPRQFNAFPADFISVEAQTSEQIALPEGQLSAMRDRTGKDCVTDREDFTLQVRNPVEGKFLIYAQNRGAKSVRVPLDMFVIFKAVVDYEKYCVVAHEELVREAEKRSANRQLSEYLAKEQLLAQGLPVIDPVKRQQ